MKEKKREMQKEEKLLTNKKLAVLSIILAIVIVSGFLLSSFLLQNTKAEFSFNAAIIDQIGANMPSNTENARIFNETATSLLENAGFTVHYYKSASVTVSLYRNLTKNNYGLIILRAHAALRNDETIVDFFTSEVFREGKYDSELNKGSLTEGSYTWEDKTYFAIAPKFIESLGGSFPKSIIIAMGCWSLKPAYEEMAQAFIGKGAQAYIGWTQEVSMSYSDNSTLRFLQYFLADNMTVSNSITQCNNNFHDPEGYSGKLSFYPSGIGGYKLPDFTMKTLSESLIISESFVSSKKRVYYQRLLISCL